MGDRCEVCEACGRADCHDALPYEDSDLRMLITMMDRDSVVSAVAHRWVAAEAELTAARETVADLTKQRDAAVLFACAQREPTAAEIGALAGMFKLEMAYENGEALSTRVGTRRCARYALMRGAIPPSESEFRAALDAYRSTSKPQEPTSE